jgi:hypothetical protein
MAEQTDRPEPDFSDDPRRGEMSDTGYPESQPDDVTGDTDFPGEGPEHGGKGVGQGETPAPSTSSEHEGGAQEATGNRRAAGD